MNAATMVGSWQALLFWQQHAEAQKRNEVAKYQHALWIAARSTRNDALRATLMNLRDELAKCVD